VRIQPRQEILDIWSATIKAAYDSRKRAFKWGGWQGENSISDAELLLCILLPATDVPLFRIERPDTTNRTVAGRLSGMGGTAEIPLSLIRGVKDYLTRYSAKDGTPTFGGAGYFVVPDGKKASPAQLALEVVDSYAVSVQLTLAALGFCRIFSESVRSPEVRTELDEIERLAARRLTAAMDGLLRSFAISVFSAEDPFGQALLRTLNPGRRPTSVVAQELRAELREISARLRTLDIGNPQPKQLEDEELLFECGWTWGIAEGAPEVEYAREAVTRKRAGHAPPEPYLYFTVVALDAIAELDSDRTRILNLLDQNQLRMASALRLRWDLTQNYWATIASFGHGRWPVEDLPWRTTDEEESDFFSLLVTSIALRGFGQRRGSNEALGRLGSVLAELASRGRVTRRPTRNDNRAIELHHPGVRFELLGSELETGIRLSWLGQDFAPLLLKQSLQIAGLISNVETRGRMLLLADDVWAHLVRRRFRDDDTKGLWDQPKQEFEAIPVTAKEVSWHQTMRVVEALLVAARLTSSDPLRGTHLGGLSAELLVEVEHRYDREVLQGGLEANNQLGADLRRLGRRLQRAREIISDEPGSATALLLNVLLDLDGLAAAPQNVERPSL
jgi:hypothetical protein